jgi:two-component system, chemotaxis family, chemotaxis protein CheY
MKLCLIVDDSKVVRTVAKHFFQELGFSTNEAEDGKQALTSCLENVPDIILLDWNMPVMTGLEFLKALRQQQIENQPIVIFCTTENDIDHITLAIEAGANEYIMKPFDMDILRTKLEQVGAL